MPEELPTAETSKRYLTVSEAAAELGLSPSSVQLLVERGALRAWKTVGGHRRIDPGSVRELLSQRSAAPPPPVLQRATVHSLPVSREPRALDVVVAEDDEFLIKIYASKFAAADFTIAPRFVHDGVQALLAVGAQLPDALILDLNMPGLGGKDTLAALRRDAHTSRLPVFIVTGMDDTEIESLKPLPPGTVVLRKPAPFERLLGSLQALFVVKELRA